MHKIDIPSHIIEACIARRGKVHAVNRLDLAATALVVIDMQHSWLDAGAACEIPQARSIIDNINMLANAIRANSGKVAWTQSSFGADWTRTAYRHLGDPEWIERIITETNPAHPGYRISDRMDLKTGDIVSQKSRPSALIQGSSDLHDQLQAIGISTLIITGTLTNACCESTARDAAALGYEVLFASDGTATRSDTEHNATLINLMQLVADVRTCTELVDLIRRSAVA